MRSSTRSRVTRARCRPNHAPRQKCVPARRRDAPPPCGGCRTVRGRSSGGGRGWPTTAPRRSAPLLEVDARERDVAAVVWRVAVPTGPAQRRVSSTAAFTSERSARTCSSCDGVREQAHSVSAITSRGSCRPPREHERRVRDDLLAAHAPAVFARGAASTRAPTRRARRASRSSTSPIAAPAPRWPRRPAPASPDRPRSSRGRASCPRSSAGCPARAPPPARA